MPQVQLKTQIVTRRGRDPEMLMRVNLLPKGSGNRNLARRLAKEFRLHPIMGPHVVDVRVGTSAVLVYFKPSMTLAAGMAEMWRDALQKQADDVPGQQVLFPAT